MPNISRFHFDKSYKDCVPIGGFILCQVGDLSCESGYEVVKHTQWCYEISYVVSGKGISYNDGKPLKMKKGDVIFSKKGESHYIRSDIVDPVRFLYLGFDLAENCGEPFQEIIKYLTASEEIQVSDRFDLSAYFYSILNELLLERRYSEVIIKNNLENLLIVVYREFIKETSRVYARHDYKDSFIYDIMYYIDCNIRSIRTMEDIAEDFGYSYSYIAREFMRVTSRTMKDYVFERKFEIAENLLTNSDKNITDIAEELSFSSIHTFSRAFRRKYGVSPKQFKWEYHAGSH